MRDKPVLVHVHLEDREKRERGMIGYRPSEGLAEELEPSMVHGVRAVKW